MTPEQAKAWLDVNHRNRTLSTGAVTRIAGIIRRGEWMEDSTDAVGIDTDGGVVNGQHRLAAVIEADTAVEMLVVTDVRPEVIKVIDQGRGRTFNQWLAMDGRYNQPAILGGAVDWLYRMTEGYEARMPDSVKPTVPQLLDLLDEHKNVELSIEPATAVYNRIKLPKPWLAAYHYAMASADSERADEFYSQLATGEASVNEPVFVLRERYFANYAAKTGNQASTPELIVWLVKAWNAAAEGATITPKQLSWIKSGKRAEIFPKVGGVEWLPSGKLDLSSGPAAA